jgi:hypothetical protein
MCTGRREEVSRLRAEQKKRWLSVMQDDKLPPAVFEKGLRGRNSPICTLTQNGYGDQRANAWKHICFLVLDKITALHVHGALGLIYFPDHIHVACTDDCVPRRHQSHVHVAAADGFAPSRQ